MTVDDLDIWRSAKLAIDEYGAAAWFYAAIRFDELRKAGDLDGAAVWRRVADAIAKLDDMEASAATH